MYVDDGVDVCECVKWCGDGVSDVCVLECVMVWLVWLRVTTVLGEGEDARVVANEAFVNNL